MFCSFSHFCNWNPKKFCLFLAKNIVYFYTESIESLTFKIRCILQKLLPKNQICTIFSECVFFSVGHLHKSRHNPQINVLGACWLYFFCSLLCLLPNNNFCSSFPIEICQKTRLYRSLRGEKSVWDMTGTCSRYSI